MGYATVEALADSIIARKGQVMRGHEFHWSQRDDPTVQAAYHFGDGNRQEGFVAGNILASYVHLHFGSDVTLAQRFIQSCEEWRGGSGSTTKAQRAQRRNV
jgi:cobyrinic acid a,c-diamide synthase